MSESLRKRVPQGERLGLLVEHCRAHGRVTVDEAARILQQPRLRAASSLRNLAVGGWFSHVGVNTFALTLKSAEWRGSVKMRVLGALHNCRVMSIGAVAEATGRPRGATRVYLCKLHQRGLIARVAEGVYRGLEASDATAE